MFNIMRKKTPSYAHLGSNQCHHLSTRSLRNNALSHIILSYVGSSEVLPVRKVKGSTDLGILNLDITW